MRLVFYLVLLYVLVELIHLFFRKLLNLKQDKVIKKKIKKSVKLIDNLKIDGDFVESQAFAYLAIRSYLKLPISFPSTTGVSKPCTGGVVVKN